MEYILVSIFFGFITGAIGRYIAKEKNRSPSEGFWFGFLLSLFGVLIIALMPSKESIFHPIKSYKKPISQKTLRNRVIIILSILALIVLSGIVTSLIP